MTIGQPTSTLPELSYKVGESKLTFKTVNLDDLQLLKLNFQPEQANSPFVVNVVASGPSIKQTKFDEQTLALPTIFVNGSISLLADYAFTKPMAYVISDERFIEHNFAVLQQFYQGIAWFITLPVLQALIKKSPDLVKKYHAAIHIIYAVDRPIVQNNPSSIKGLFTKFVKSNNYQLEKKSLSDILANDAQLAQSFVIDAQHEPIIGVSLDISNGFFEAGTVAFVATQLAFCLGTTQIHLYGMDLTNAQQPRFYETSQNQAPSKLDKAVKNRIVPSFDLLAATYDKHNCQVVNHSPFSKSLFTKLAYFE